MARPLALAINSRVIKLIDWSFDRLWSLLRLEDFQRLVVASPSLQTPTNFVHFIFIYHSLINTQRVLYTMHLSRFTCDCTVFFCNSGRIPLLFKFASLSNNSLTFFFYTRNYRHYSFLSWGIGVQLTVSTEREWMIFLKEVYIYILNYLQSVNVFIKRQNKFTWNFVTKNELILAVILITRKTAPQCAQSKRECSESLLER